MTSRPAIKLTRFWDALERFKRGDLGVLGVVRAPPVTMSGVIVDEKRFDIVSRFKDGAEGEVVSLGRVGEREGETGLDQALRRCCWAKLLEERFGDAVPEAGSASG